MSIIKTSCYAILSVLCAVSCYAQEIRPISDGLACKIDDDGKQYLVRVTAEAVVEKELGQKNCNKRIRKTKKHVRSLLERLKVLRREFKQVSRDSRRTQLRKDKRRRIKLANRVERLQKRRQELIELRRTLIACCRGSMPPIPPSETPMPEPTPEQPPGEPEADPTPDPLPRTEEISQYGITWTFDKAYEYGQYVNGDYWVKGESVTITHIAPLPVEKEVPVSYNPVAHEQRFVHGSMVNPPTGKQAYDSRIASYDQTLRVNLPITLVAGESLVSAHSTEDFNCSAGSQGVGNRDLRGTCIPGRHHLQSAAVLTIVSEAPGQSEFRPPYLAGDKTRYSAEDIHWERLPSLSDVPNAPEDLEYFLRGLERPWISHIDGANSRMLHPFENMLGYHAVIYSYYDELSLALLLDHPDQRKLAQLYIQHGIDMYHMVIAGHGGSGTSKHAIIFAGLMLDKPEMYTNINERSLTPFRTDYMTYYGDDVRSDVVSDCLSADGDPIDDCVIIPQGEFYHGYHVGWRQGYVSREYEHLDPAEWIETSQCGSTGTRCETYRHINSSAWSGQALSMKLLSAEDEWDHSPFFEYVYRYVELEENTPDGLKGSMWQLFKEVFE